MAKLQDIELQDFLDAFEQRMGGSFGGGSSSSGKNKNTAKGKNSSKSGGVLENFTKTINNLSFATRSLFNVTKNLLAPWAEVDQAAANFSKNIGLSAKGLENLRKTSIRFVKEGNLGALFDVSAQELIKLQEDYAKAVGRNVTMGREAIEYLAASTKLEGSTEMITKMENFGISMKDAGERVGKIFANSTKHGIAWAKMAKTINENFDIAQNYNFSKGQKAFYKMAEKAAEINLDMKQTAAFADKFSTIEGAIEGSANLQVLGGAFARMASNPLELMRKSLMAPDELQDDIIKTFGSFGSYNTEKGEFEMDWVSRERVKEAAKATGMDYSNVMGMIQNNARREAIGKALEYNPNNFDEDTIRLIKNVGVMQNGQAGLFDKDGKFVKAQNLTTREIEELAALQQSDSDNLKDIVADLRGVKEILSGTDKQIKNKFAEKGEQWGVGQGIKNIFDNISRSNTLLGIIAGLQGVGMVSGGLRGIGRVGGGTSGNGGALSGIKEAWRAGKGASRARHLHKAGKLAKGVGKKVLKAGKGGGITAGLISGAITGYEEFLTDNNHSTGKKIGRTTGSVLGGGFGAWGGAAGGAALGQLLIPIPGVGAVIGGLVGGAVGGAAGSELLKWAGGGFSSDKRRNKFRNELGLTELKGDYSVKELREIKNAISNHGVISDKLQEKIDKNQDKDIIEEIRQRPVGVNVENWPEKMGGRHAFGGIVTGPGSGTSDSIPTWLSNGESVMTAKATKMFGPELSVMNRLSGGSGDFGSIKPNVRELNAGMIDVKAPSPSVNKISPSMGGTVGGTININFSPIKIEFPNGANKDITNDLLSNPVFMRDLTRKIEEGLIRSGNGGHLIVRQGNKFV